MDASDQSPQDLARERGRKITALRRHEEEKRARELAEKLGLPYLDLAVTPIDGDALTLRPIAEQKTANAVVIRSDDRSLTVAAQDPQSAAFAAFRDALAKDGFTAVPHIVSRTSLEYAWAIYPRFSYLKTRTTGEVAIQQETLDRFQEEILDLSMLTRRLEGVEGADLSSLVELLLAGAVKFDASDIHVEPQEEESEKEMDAKIRYRLDGVLHDLLTIRKNVYALLLERVKLLGGLKLNITRKSQDGRFTIRARSQTIEVRASVLPGRAGEFIVLRLLNPKSLIDIPRLGLRKDLLAAIEEELRRPNGMILTTGPTGSGKTTMLYAFLRRVAKSEVKTITIEDPIEYRVEGLEQTQVDPSAGYTFAVGLRSIVRQDPDIILVGEIRDEETASIATHAALTGHLVFSTLHTNDAAGAIPRLIDMGINPTVLGPALNVVMAQRLVRRLCGACAKPATADTELQKAIREAIGALPPAVHAPDLTTVALRQAIGCTDCHGTGYRGRIGIFELFRVDEEIERFALKRPAIAEVRAFAIERGMVTLQQDALLRTIEGITTIDEVVRVTGPLKAPHEADVPLTPPDEAAVASDATATMRP